MHDSDLNPFIKDGVVHAAASMFPVELIKNSAGRSPVRLMILFNHENNSWWVAAWASSPYSGNPERVLLAEIITADVITVSRIELTLEDSVKVIAIPSRGGCCGNRLKSWNPFGDGVILAHRPYHS